MRTKYWRLWLGERPFVCVYSRVIIDEIENKGCGPMEPMMQVQGLSVGVKTYL